MLDHHIFFRGEKAGYISASIKRDNPSAACVSGLGTPDLTTQLHVLGIPETYPAALLNNIEIEPAFRRSGLGSAALAFFEDLAFADSCGFCYCKIGFNNLRALRRNVRFYQRNGWETFCHDGQGRIEGIPREFLWSLGYKIPVGNNWQCPEHIEFRRIEEEEKLRNYLSSLCPRPADQ